MAKPGYEHFAGPLGSAPQGLLNNPRIAVEKRQQDPGRLLQRAAALE
jgi:hypothetical protein